MSINLSSRFIKNTALEGTFSAQQNIVSFSIPSGMKIDLSESTVLVDLSVQDTDTNARNLPQFDGVAGVYRQAVTFDDAGDTNRVLPTVAYVKNADIRCEKVGQIESLRAVNTLRLGMYHYQEDSDTQKDQQYLGLGNSDDIGGMNGSPFRDLVRQGTIKSRDRNGILRIPLHNIFDVAKAPVWDTNKYGRTDIKLEMAFDKMNIRQTMGQTDLNWANFNYQNIDAPNGGLVFAANTTVNAFKSSNAYFHPERKMPFHVGQKLIFQYTATNGGNATVFSIANGTQKERTISQIQHNVDNDNKVTITFVDGIAFLQDDIITAMTVVGADSATSTLVFNKIELEMKQVNDPTPSSIQYTTYSTEEDSGFVATQTNINKQYTCEGESDNLVICALGSNAGIVKQNPTIRVNSSRITIDSKEETPERVVGLVVGGVNQAQPLYYDRIDRAFLNMGEDVESLYEKQYNFNQGLPTNPAGEASTLFQPLPLKPAPKQVQLDLDYTAGQIHTLKLYKRMVKEI